MPLALTPEMLIVVGVAAVVLVVALMVVVVLRRRRRPPRPETGSPATVGSTEEQVWREPPPVADRAGSGRTVASAVAQALATREARGIGGSPPAGRGDARDRLLAVLLDDPMRAVGAAVELESCRRRLDRLAGALEHERSTLRDVLDRLTAAGLSPDQLARLAGPSDPELRALLPERAPV